MASAVTYLVKLAGFIYGLVTLSYWLCLLTFSGAVFPLPNRQKKDELNAYQQFLWHHPSPDPVNWKHASITIEGIKLHYVAYKHRKTNKPNPDIVFLLHGFPDSWAIWYPFLEQLSQSKQDDHLGTTKVSDGTVFIAVDLPGYGGSDSPADFSPDTYLNLVALFICQMRKKLSKELPDEEVGRVLVVGHDWGATIAYRLAQQAPQLADRFILINSMFPDLVKANVKSEVEGAKALLKGWNNKSWALKGRMVKKALHNLEPVISQLGKSCYIFVFNLPWPFLSWLGYLGEYAFLRLLHTFEYPVWPEAAVSDMTGEKETSPVTTPNLSIWNSAKAIPSLKSQKELFLLATSIGPASNPSSSSGQIPITYPASITTRTHTGGLTTKIRLYRDGLAIRRWHLSPSLRSELEDIVSAFHALHASHQSRRGSNRRDSITVALESRARGRENWPTKPSLVELSPTTSHHDNEKPVKKEEGKERRAPPPLDPALHVTPVNGDVRAPTTVVWGLDDPVLDARLVLRGIKDYLPVHSQVVTLKGVGHGVVHEPRGMAVLERVVAWALDGEVERLGGEHGGLAGFGWCRVEAEK